jgi:EpsI family protein
MQKRLIILAVLFAITIAGVAAATKSRGQQNHLPNWGMVAYQVEDWQGKETGFDPVYGSDPADSSLLRIYTRGQEPPVIVYAGFYSDLAKILEVHTPELCYPAQGWRIAPAGRSYAGSFRGQPIRAKTILADKAGQQRLVTWWYNAGSKPFESRIRYVYGMLAMSAITGRTDGSLVRIESPIDSSGQAAAEKRIEQFRQAFLPQLEKGLP